MNTVHKAAAKPPWLSGAGGGGLVAACCPFAGLAPSPRRRLCCCRCSEGERVLSPPTGWSLSACFLLENEAQR